MNILEALRDLFYIHPAGSRLWHLLCDTLSRATDHDPLPIIDYCRPRLSSWPPAVPRQAPAPWIQGALAGTPPPWLTLADTLKLDDRALGDEGLIKLLQSADLSALRHLSLQRNLLSDLSATALASAPNLSPECHISLLDNPIGEAGAQVLAARFGANWCPATDHRLLAIAGRVQGQSFALEANTTIGRSPQNTITIADVTTSRFHCALRVHDPFHIEAVDLGSSCGIFVNARKLPGQRATLLVGDVLMVGHTMFRLLTPVEAASMEAFRLGLDRPEGPESILEGPLEWMPVESLLAFVEGTGKTAALAIKGEVEGEVVFEEGRATRASVVGHPELDDEAALHRLRRCHTGWFRFSPNRA